MLQAKIEIQVTLRQSDILPQTVSNPNVSEGILTYMNYFSFFFKYIHWTATEGSNHQKSFASR